MCTLDRCPLAYRLLFTNLVEGVFSELHLHRVLTGLCVLRLAASRVSCAYPAKLPPVADRAADTVERPVTKLRDHEVFVNAIFVA